MRLNINAIESAMRARGVSQSDLATNLEVSRESVSKWLKGDAMPRPKRVLRLSRLLGLEFDEIYKQRVASEPVVAFRKKGNSKTTEEHFARAKDMGYLLRQLVEYLPFELLTHPASFVDPTDEYGFVTKAAADIRSRMGLKSPFVDFSDIIRFFAEAHAVLIPVMWGKRKLHENALHIYLPDSKTTWVYINLDSKIMDFKFWMAHELAHVKAPELPYEEAERFADRFAAELLFPVSIADEYTATINSKLDPGVAVNKIQDVAREFVISPVTVFQQINRALEAHGERPIGVNIYPSTTNFNKSFLDVNEIVFGTDNPTPANYVRVCTDEFETPIFSALGSYLRASGKQDSFLQRVLNVGVLDAKNLYPAVMTADDAKDPA